MTRRATISTSSRFAAGSGRGTTPAARDIAVEALETSVYWSETLAQQVMAGLAGFGSPRRAGSPTHGQIPTRSRAGKLRRRRVRSIDDMTRHGGVAAGSLDSSTELTPQHLSQGDVAQRHPLALP